MASQQQQQQQQPSKNINQIANKSYPKAQTNQGTVNVVALNTKTIKNQVRKSLTPQNATSNITKMSMQRKSLASLINEYESIEKDDTTHSESKKQSPSQKSSLNSSYPEKDLITSSTKFKDVEIPSSTNQQQLITKSNSSMSSTETIKATALQSVDETSSPSLVTKTSSEPSAEGVKSPKERFKFRKLMPISKASVLSNNLSHDNLTTEIGGRASSMNNRVSFLNVNKSNNRYKPLGLTRGLTTLDSSQMMNNGGGELSKASVGATATANEPLVFMSLNKLLNRKTSSPKGSSRVVTKSYQSVFFKSELDKLKKSDT